MRQPFQQSKGLQLVLGFCVVAITGLWLLLTFLFLREPTLGMGWLLALLTPLFWGWIIWATAVLFWLPHTIELEETAVTLLYPRHTQTIDYTQIQAVRRSFLFLTLHTKNGRIRLDRQISRLDALYDELHRRVPTLRQAHQALIDAPLPLCSRQDALRRK